MEKRIIVGSSSSNSKKIRLPATNMTVSPTPLNPQLSEWKDTFKVDIDVYDGDGAWATVTRTDQPHGWDQNLILMATTTIASRAPRKDLSHIDTTNRTTTTTTTTKSIKPKKQKVTIINVGVSNQPTKVVNLPKPHMIVSSTPSNFQRPGWKDTFEVNVSGNKLHVRRSDKPCGWGQNLQFKAIPDPKWDKIINVGSSPSSNSKKVLLPDINMAVSRYPVNKQGMFWKDSFKVDVDGIHATITRVDSDGGWGQDLVLYGREIGKNSGTDSGIDSGTDDDNAFSTVNDDNDDNINTSVEKAKWWE
jgi:hypothetical protein